MNRWQLVLYQQALNEIDSLQSSERRAMRAALVRLVENPWQTPDAQIRPPNDRVYLVRNVERIRVNLAVLNPPRM
jgi:hypothetical protein